MAPPSGEKWDVPAVAAYHAARARSSCQDQHIGAQPRAGRPPVAGDLAPGHGPLPRRHGARRPPRHRCASRRRRHRRHSRRRHRPRNSRILRTIAFRPEGHPGIPIPRYFANGLFSRTGRTRIAAPSSSKINLSPGPTPKARRISRGTVICPLLVIFACFLSAFRISLLYHTSPYILEA